MRLLLLATLAACAIDQITKYLAVHIMRVDMGEVEVLPPLLVFRYGENRGINFGLFQGNSDAARWLLIGVSLAICIGVLIWLFRMNPGKLVQISAGLLIGGALGNVVDRLLYGYVLDFLNMSCCGINNPYVFNLADVFIFAGAIGLVLFDGKKPS